MFEVWSILFRFYMLCICHIYSFCLIFFVAICRYKKQVSWYKEQFRSNSHNKINQLVNQWNWGTRARVRGCERSFFSFYLEKETHKSFTMELRCIKWLPRLMSRSTRFNGDKNLASIAPAETFTQIWTNLHNLNITFMRNTFFLCGDIPVNNLQLKIPSCKTLDPLVSNERWVPKNTFSARASALVSCVSLLAISPRRHSKDLEVWRLARRWLVARTTAGTTTAPSSAWQRRRSTRSASTTARTATTCSLKMCWWVFGRATLDLGQKFSR